jgi:putative sigma-54 modulation protein
VTLAPGPAGRQPPRRIEQTPVVDYNSLNAHASPSPVEATTTKKGVGPVQIKIATRHGHLSEETQEHIREKAQKLLHYFERLTMIEVTVDLGKDGKHVEFVVQAEHKHDFVARESNGELFAAVDLALHKIEEQIRRYKQRIQDHRRTPSVGTVAPPEPEQSPEE